MKKFLLIDDHFVVRSGMKSLLAELYNPCEIYEASDSEKAIALLQQHHYEMILMDVQIPNNDMMGMMEYIHIKYPDARVLVFSMSPENIYAKRFLKAGAKGFLTKDSSIDETIKAFTLVLSNRRYISEKLADLLADETLYDTPENPFDKLSAREFEIASMMLTGQSLSDIGKTLSLQPSTVGTHKANLFKKMAVSNILQLKELAMLYLHK